MYQIGQNTRYGVIVQKGDELLPEFVYHYPDPEGGPALSQFLYANLEDPHNKVESWCTQNGEWDGPRKMRTFQIVDADPYLEGVLMETNEQPDRTFGVTGAVVFQPINHRRGQFIAVNKHQMRRFAGPQGLVESKRHRHGSKDVLPEVTPTGYTVMEYSAAYLGLNLLNSACIHAVGLDGTHRLALVRPELVVIEGDQLPPINEPFEWMLMSDFLFLTLDSPTKTILGAAIVAGYVRKPTKSYVQKSLAKLPSFIATQCK